MADNPILRSLEGVHPSWVWPFWHTIVHGDCCSSFSTREIPIWWRACKPVSKKESLSIWTLHTSILMFSSSMNNSITMTTHMENSRPLFTTPWMELTLSKSFLLSKIVPMLIVKIMFGPTLNIAYTAQIFQTNIISKTIIMRMQALGFDWFYLNATLRKENALQNLRFVISSRATYSIYNSKRWHQLWMTIVAENPFLRNMLPRIIQFVMREILFREKNFSFRNLKSNSMMTPLVCLTIQRCMIFRSGKSQITSSTNNPIKIF